MIIYPNSSHYNEIENRTGSSSLPSDEQFRMKLFNKSLTSINNLRLTEYPKYCNLTIDKIVERFINYRSFYIGFRCKGYDGYRNIARFSHDLQMNIWSMKTVNFIEKDYMLIDEREETLYTIYQHHTYYVPVTFLVIANPAYPVENSNYKYLNGTLVQLKSPSPNCVAKSMQFYSKDKIGLIIANHKECFLCLYRIDRSFETYD